MNSNVLAVLIQTGGQLLSQHLQNRQVHIQSPENTINEFMQESDARMAPFIAPIPENTVIQIEPRIIAPAVIDSEEVFDGQAEEIPTGCVPCSIGHLGTCAGLLNEAVRFADNGMADREVTKRALMCLQELNTMERVDLRSQMISQLHGEERELAEQALKVSRDARHSIEGMRTREDLVQAAAKLSTRQMDIGTRWFDLKLNSLSPEDQEEVRAKIRDKMREENDGQVQH